VKQRNKEKDSEHLLIANYLTNYCLIQPVKISVVLQTIMRQNLQMDLEKLISCTLASYKDGSRPKKAGEHIIFKLFSKLSLIKHTASLDKVFQT